MGRESQAEQERQFLNNFINSMLSPIYGPNESYVEAASYIVSQDNLSMPKPQVAEACHNVYALYTQSMAIYEPKIKFTPFTYEEQQIIGLVLVGRTNQAIPLPLEKACRLLANGQDPDNSARFFHAAFYSGLEKVFDRKAAIYKARDLANRRKSGSRKLPQ